MKHLIINNKTHLAIISLISIAFLIFTIFTFASEITKSNFFLNSDQLFFPYFYHDIFSLHGKIIDWTFPPSLYFFPDTLINFVSYFISENLLKFENITLIIQTSLFFILIFFLISYFFDFITSLTNTLLLITLFTLLGYLFHEPFGFHLISAFHFGNTLNLLIIINLLLRSKYGLYKKYFLALLVGIFSFSDRLFIIQFTLPFFILYGGVKNAKSYLYLIPTVLFLVAQKLFIPNMGRLDSNLSLNPYNFVHKIYQFIDFTFHPFNLVLFKLVIFFPLYIYLIKKNKINNKLVPIFKFYFFSFIITFLITSLSERDFGSRYLQSYYYFSYILLFLFISKYKFPSIFFLLVNLLIFSSVLQNPIIIDKAPINNDYITCVNKIIKDPVIGVANYWDAIPTQLLIQQKNKILIVKDDLSPLNWITNTSYYKSPVNFIIFNSYSDGSYNLSKNYALSFIHQTPVITSCGNHEIWYYKSPFYLPTLSLLEKVQLTTYGSFIKNPRALLLISLNIKKSGDNNKSQLFFNEAISLLKKNNATEKLLEQYRKIYDGN